MYRFVDGSVEELMSKVPRGWLYDQNVMSPEQLQLALTNSRQR